MFFFSSSLQWRRRTALRFGLVLGSCMVLAGTACGAPPAVTNSLHVSAPYKYHGMWVFDVLVFTEAPRKIYVKVEPRKS